MLQSECLAALRAILRASSVLQAKYLAAGQPLYRMSLRVPHVPPAAAAEAAAAAAAAAGVSNAG